MSVGVCARIADFLIDCRAQRDETGESECQQHALRQVGNVIMRLLLSSSSET